MSSYSGVKPCVRARAPGVLVGQTGSKTRQVTAFLSSCDARLHVPGVKSDFAGHEPRFGRAMPSFSLDTFERHLAPSESVTTEEPLPAHDPTRRCQLKAGYSPEALLFQDY